MAASRARRLWLDVHLYVGLVLGGLFALLGLTGSVLVFYLGVDEALNPALQVSRPVIEAPSPDAVLSRVQAVYPEHDGPWRIEMPLDANDALRVRYYNPPETAGRGFAPLMLSLDPDSLQVTSGRLWGDYAVTWLYDLHYTLLLGSAGKTAVGIAGLVLLVSLFSGLYLWWPSRARLGAALKPVLRRGVVRKTYDLHVLSGVYGFVVLAVLALTGSVLALPDEARSVVDRFSPLRPSFRAPAGLLEEGATPIPLAEAVRIAQARFPGAELRWIETPGRAGKPISVRFHQAAEPGRRFPRSQVWVHPASGDILAVRDPLENSGGDTFMDWMHPLHNGEVFGLAGRLLACLGGLLPTLAFATGWLRWRHKVRARKASTRSLARAPSIT
ncbi:PepSY domain-containing protein [Zoogloea oleivorans]|uniref:PepSY domain-containing protein n=1 Tax=Zoogloea oleivorans TaxID=1552750 RepID=A0A6C2CR04_9RHOO|nr:PepSY-associated TM helix domain-containing protein [Zoogloea oleivorans]TYC56510.1 PepSY domain-containing protein [Zoogloea oleivorans]